MSGESLGVLLEEMFEDWKRRREKVWEEVAKSLKGKHVGEK
mgnify:CR=1 FL=1